ncbi:MAG: putative 4-hydroxybenzoate polyprenyltransferase [Chloroflexota bacterium]|nr:putative 4-hydroxybenzoate polyprenyltransferase [Chloroflexota bacterium]
MIKKIGVFYEAIKFEHTIFALPFAYLGMVLAARGLPSGWQVLWITLAMVGARSFAMAMNRLVDASHDALNPRTANRALPRRLLRPLEMLLFALLSLGLLFFCAWQLNPLCVILLPVAILFLLTYSYTKRFTWLCHLVLGITDGIAPIGGWIAVNPTLSVANLLPPLLLGLAVAAWVCGFDLIYSCQDLEFDHKMGLHSVPVRFGIAAALRLSTLMHSLTIILLLAVGVLLHLGLLYWLGLIIAAGLLIYEHRLISPTDLSRLNVAFFNMNGYIAVIVFLCTCLAIYIRLP